MARLATPLPCNPAPLQPQPAALRYRFSSPVTVYSRGIERVLAAYETDYLDADTFRSIISSAKANSKALIGKQKPRFLDSAQKKEALHRVTVVPILAHRIDPRMLSDLYALACKQSGDEYENCLLPCIIDTEHGTCVFDSMRIPYVRFSYAVKNRGIRLIKKTVFGGSWNLKGNQHCLPVLEDVDLNDSLWAFWKKLHHEIIGADKATKRQFDAMGSKELRVDDGALYLKWDQRMIYQILDIDVQNKVVRVETITDWYYPKIRPIGKEIKRSIEAHIVAHFSAQGYTVAFVDPEEF